MLGCKDAAKEEPAPRGQSRRSGRGSSGNLAFAEVALRQGRSTRREGRRAAQEDDGRGKSRPGHPGRHLLHHARGHEEVPPGLDPRRRRFLARQRTSARPRRTGSSSRTSSTPRPSTPATAASGIPMIWGIDAMHGHSNIVGAVLFPHNVGPRRHAQPEVVRRHRARHRRAGAHHRHRVDVRAHGDRAAGRSLGPRLRGLFGRSEAGGLVRRRSS